MQSGELVLPSLKMYTAPASPLVSPMNAADWLVSVVPVFEARVPSHPVCSAASWAVPVLTSSDRPLASAFATSVGMACSHFGGVTGTSLPS